MYDIYLAKASIFLQDMHTTSRYIKNVRNKHYNKAYNQLIKIWASQV